MPGLFDLFLQIVVHRHLLMTSLMRISVLLYMHIALNSLLFFLHCFHILFRQISSYFKRRASFSHTGNTGQCKQRTYYKDGHPLPIYLLACYLKAHAWLKKPTSVRSETQFREVLPIFSCQAFFFLFFQKEKASSSYWWHDLHLDLKKHFSALYSRLQLRLLKNSICSLWCLCKKHEKTHRESSSAPFLYLNSNVGMPE